jgi:hypothetical protein
MNAEENSTINHVHQSQKNFKVWYGNMFTVLPDGKTIIGEDYDNNNMLVLEDITKNDNDAFAEFHHHKRGIYTVFYHELSESLFAGGWNGTPVQYKKNKDTQSWSVVKEYEDVGIGCIYSFEQIGNVVLIGGSTNKFIAIDAVKQKVFERAIITVIESIHCLQVCELPNQEIYLSVSGQNPSYSEDKSDLYNATHLAKTFGHHFGTTLEDKDHHEKTIMKEHHSEGNDISLNELRILRKEVSQLKNQINSLKEMIQQIVSDSKKD